MRVSICFICVLLCASCQKPSQEVIKTSYYHSYGPAVSAGQWKEQGSTGTISTLKGDGVEVCRSYVDGVLQGSSTWSFPHSKIIERFEEYAQGHKVSSGHNFPSGVTETEEEILSPDDTLIHCWYEDGSPRSLEHFLSNHLFEAQYYNDDGELESAISNGNGVRVNRSFQGILLSREQLALGEVVSREIFHSNGVVKETCSYLHGKKEGVRKCFDEAGRPERIEMYKADRLDGSVLSFREGTKSSFVPYVEGKREGVEQHFHPDLGTVIEEITWSNDERNGPSTVYVDGAPLTTWYWRDTLVTEAQFHQNDETVKASKG